jgi:hypothetical protein
VAGGTASKTDGIGARIAATCARIAATFGKTDVTRCATAGGAIVSKIVGIGARTVAIVAKIVAIVVVNVVYANASWQA